MHTVRMRTRLLGGVFLCLAVAASLAPRVDAQDRGNPLFGPSLLPDTVETGRFDLGRSWSVAQPPIEYLRQRYDLPADERGMQHLRTGTVRLPDCSGALVSARGLVLTAARCVRSFLPETDVPLDSAFRASDPGGEAPLPDAYAERVVGVEDVTAQVDSLASTPSAADSLATGWRAAVEQVQQQRRADAADGRRVEVVRERGGARYVAYTYRRYDDVRLVFRASPEVTVFGRGGDLLTYPQHAWDVAALRIYEAGTPLDTPEHFDIRAQGARPGDPVFAVGFPSETARVETTAQHVLRRDVTLPVRHALLTRWTNALRAYVDSTADPRWRTRMQDAVEARKTTQARLEALRSDYVVARLRKRDDSLRRDPDPTAGPSAGALLDRIAALQDEKRALAESYRAYGSLLPSTPRSATLARALLVARARGAGERPSVDALEAIPEQPRALDAALLEGHLDRLGRYGGLDSTAQSAIDRLGPPTRIVRASVLASDDSTRALLRAGGIPSDDPALQLVDTFVGPYESFHRNWTALQARERRLTDSLSRIRHDRAARAPALPSDRSLRLADGRVRGYPYNGTLAPPFTTFFGLYGRFAASGPEPLAGLPDRWRAPPKPLDRSVPLAVVADTDLRGDYGGPLLNASLQLVGIRVDDNVQNAAGAYLFLPARMRTVSADIRGVLEGLSRVYGADALVEELRGTAPSAQ